MAIVVVGGHSRNVGKTSVVAGLIAGLPQLQWTAIKITQFGHGICSAKGEPCHCETADHAVAISEERGADPTTDSGRFLAAGAVRSLWVRTRQGQLFEAMPQLRRRLAEAENSIIESNSILQFLVPDLYLAVLDPGTVDFKVSARRFLDRADALISPVTDIARAGGVWSLGRDLLRGKPHFIAGSPAYCGAALCDFVADRVSARMGVTA